MDWRPDPIADPGDPDELAYVASGGSYSARDEFERRQEAVDSGMARYYQWFNTQLSGARTAVSTVKARAEAEKLAGKDLEAGLLMSSYVAGRTMVGVAEGLTFIMRPDRWLSSLRSTHILATDRGARKAVVEGIKADPAGVLAEGLGGVVGASIVGDVVRMIRDRPASKVYDVDYVERPVMVRTTGRVTGARRVKVGTTPGKVLYRKVVGMTPEKARIIREGDTLLEFVKPGTPGPDIVTVWRPSIKTVRGKSTPLYGTRHITTLEKGIASATRKMIEFSITDVPGVTTSGTPFLLTGIASALRVPSIDMPAVGLKSDLSPSSKVSDYIDQITRGRLEGGYRPRSAPDIVPDVITIPDVIPKEITRPDVIIIRDVMPDVVIDIIQRPRQRSKPLTAPMVVLPEIMDPSRETVRVPPPPVFPTFTGLGVGGVRTRPRRRRGGRAKRRKVGLGIEDWIHFIPEIKELKVKI